MRIICEVIYASLVEVICEGVTGKMTCMYARVSRVCKSMQEYGRSIMSPTAASGIMSGRGGGGRGGEKGYVCGSL